MQNRIQQVDVLKGLAIIAVILIHAIPEQTLDAIGSPYHLDQAVPVFMVLMGFNGAMSFSKRNYEKLADFYTHHTISTKIGRLLKPFLVVFLIEEIVLASFRGFSLGSFVYNFLSGGAGYGGYFIPVTIQATVLLPIIYWILKKTQGWGGIALFFLVGYLADSFGSYLGEELYRLFIGRYLFALALGVYLFFHKERIKVKHLVPLALLSLLYIFLVENAGMSTLMETYWGSQHTPSYFWTLLLVVVGMKWGRVLEGGRALATIGKSSYHIFLVQHLYFYIENEFYPISSNRLNLVVSLLFCVLGGFLLRWMDRKYKATRTV